MLKLSMQRKAATDKQPQSKPRLQKSSRQAEAPSPNPLEDEMDDLPPPTETLPQRPKRLKRPTKSVNENIEPAFTANPSISQHP